jgi:hypothetical protein
LKKKVQMEDGIFPDSKKKPLYFEPSHPKAGLFKGMYGSYFTGTWPNYKVQPEGLVPL